MILVIRFATIGMTTVSSQCVKTIFSLPEIQDADHTSGGKGYDEISRGDPHVQRISKTNKEQPWGTKFDQL